MTHKETERLAVVEQKVDTLIQHLDDHMVREESLIQSRMKSVIAVVTILLTVLGGILGYMINEINENSASIQDVNVRIERIPLETLRLLNEQYNFN